MRIKEAIREVSGFRYMIENLNVRSSLGRRYLYELPWLNRKEEIESEQRKMKEVMLLGGDVEAEERMEKIGRKLALVRDIQGTVMRIGEANVADDLELFELKSFALLAVEIRKLLGKWTFARIPDLTPLVVLLDPEGTRIPHFYIYDVYSPELSAVRKELKKKKQEGAEEQEIESLYFKSVELEDVVRVRLSECIRSLHTDIEGALKEVALLDVLLAKVRQAVKWGLCCPEIVTDVCAAIVYQGLFHPEVKAVLEQEGKKFQPVSVEVKPLATLITGANMAGKTVLLKSVALSQYLAQFGFFVPAERAVVKPVEEVMTCIGDEQDELSGLSSYAAEMLRVDGIVSRVKSGKKVLVLIDELARTTNPVEGRAIVNGVLELFTRYATGALVTTHYSGITANCRSLRVKGFMDHRVEGKLTWKNINEFIDYSLVEENGEDVPHEAIRIARMLGVDEGLLDEVERFLKCEK
ncbi:MAG: DNA mismatch repair protein MutS [Odoribacter sp.]